MPKMGLRKSFPENYQSNTQRVSRQLVRKKAGAEGAERQKELLQTACGLVCKEVSGSAIEWKEWLMQNKSEEGARARSSRPGEGHKAAQHLKVVTLQSKVSGKLTEAGQGSIQREGMEQLPGASKEHQPLHQKQHTTAHPCPCNTKTKSIGSPGSNQCTHQIPRITLGSTLIQKFTV